MNNLLGINGNNFSIIATDKDYDYSILKIKSLTSKFYSINDVVIGCIGDQGDCFRECEYLIEKLKYENIENGLEIDPTVIGNVISKRIQKKLRNNPVNIQLIIANKNKLVALDTYGAMVETNFYANGYSSYFLYGILDKEYRKEITKEEALDLIKKCLAIMKNRTVIGIDKWEIRIIDNEGIKSETIVA